MGWKEGYCQALSGYGITMSVDELPTAAVLRTTMNGIGTWFNTLINDQRTLLILNTVQGLPGAMAGAGFFSDWANAVRLFPDNVPLQQAIEHAHAAYDAARQGQSGSELDLEDQLEGL
jgi:hypothetical protein